MYAEQSAGEEQIITDLTGRLGKIIWKLKKH